MVGTAGYDFNIFEFILGMQQLQHLEEEKEYKPCKAH